MKVFLAVLVDLWEFVLELLLPNKVRQPQSYVAPLLLTQHKDYLALEKGGSIEVTNDASSKSAETISPSMITALPVGYIATAKTPVLAGPLWALDTKLSEYEYGKKVSILGYEGRFVHILYQNESAWILKDDLRTKREDVFPNFLVNNIYLASDSETRKLRYLINDAFFASEIYAPLQGIEFVAYKLKELNINIPWGDERPRLAGQWHELLKGHVGVKIGILPKKGSVLEGRLEDGIGFLGYVTAVYPDEGISLLSVGKTVEGKYQEEKLSKGEWQALQAVFIQVS